MAKSPDAFRSIGEVSDLIGVAPHVLRYWESQFPQLSPVKRADGRRYYRPDDVRLAAGLCQVMREEGLSIRGAKRLIASDRGAGLRGIGAARLETMATPADTAPAAAIDPPAPVNGAAPPQPPPPRAESQPPFDAPAPASAPDWLDRLAAMAAGLRRRELAGTSLPAQAERLRDALRCTR